MFSVSRCADVVDSFVVLYFICSKCVIILLYALCAEYTTLSTEYANEIKGLKRKRN